MSLLSAEQIRLMSFSSIGPSRLQPRFGHAALAALLLSITLWLADWGQRLDPDSTLLGGISTLSRLRSFAVGLISVADVAYFALGALMCAAITVWAVEHERRFT